MPTYKIDLGTAPDGWGQAASALAAALAPNPDAEIKGRLAAAQATNDYAGAYANEQLGRTRAADAVLQERQNVNVLAMDEELRLRGMNDPIKRMQIITANLPLTTDPDILAANVGDINLAGAAAWGADDPTLDRLSVGAGNPYTGTAAAFARTMEESNRKWQAEQDAARAKADADRIAEDQRAARTPVIVGQDAVAYHLRGDQRFQPGDNGIAAGPVSLGDKEQFRPVVGDPISGPNFREDAPDAPDPKTFYDGNFVEQRVWSQLDDGTYGWKVEGRGPRTGADGTKITDPLEKAFTNDTVDMLTSALEMGKNAPGELSRLDQTIALLKDGVPSGFWTNNTMPLRQAMADFGIADPVLTGKIEKLTADLGSRVMARIAETKGAVSNSEMDYFRRISASIGQTPVGNLMLLQAERRIWERAQRMRNYVETLRGMTEGEARDNLNAWVKANPLFTEAELRNPDLLTPNPDTGYATTLAEPDAGPITPDIIENAGRYDP